MNLYEVPAPAKINLFLHIVGRRPDGYHLLQTVFRFIDLADTLHFELRRDAAIVRTDALPGVPPETDLMVRAAQLLQATTGVRLGATIGLEKHIPMGGGLGGGSSDAATTLIALNRLWRTGLTRAALMRLAGRLGADVPVFVFGQCAFAQGVGDVLSALSLPPRAYLIVQPDVQVPTAAVYADPDLTRNTACITMADFIASWNDPKHDPSQGGTSFGRNDFEPVVYRRFPEVARAVKGLALFAKGSITGSMQEAVQVQSQGQGNMLGGVPPISFRLSGSGACLFAEFADMQAAMMAQQKIAVTMRATDRTPGMSHTMQEPLRFRLLQACSGLIEHPLRHWTAD